MNYARFLPNDPPHWCPLVLSHFLYFRPPSHLQLRSAGDEVTALLMLDAPGMRMAWELASQPWVIGYSWVRAWKINVVRAGVSHWQL